MAILSSYMKADHRACDEAFANMENEVSDENWTMPLSYLKLLQVI